MRTQILINRDPNTTKIKRESSSKKGLHRDSFWLSEILLKALDVPIMSPGVGLLAPDLGHHLLVVSRLHSLIQGLGTPESHSMNNSSTWSLVSMTRAMIIFRVNDKFDPVVSQRSTIVMCTASTWKGDLNLSKRGPKGDLRQQKRGLNGDLKKAYI